jgi:hypothetical protein
MAAAKPLRIVVAEDEPNTRQYLLDLLTRRGHEAVALPRFESGPSPLSGRCWRGAVRSFSG